MTRPKIQSLRDLEGEMRAVARGEKAPPKDAAAPSFDSVAVLMRLLTPENRKLMAIIATESRSRSRNLPSGPAALPPTSPHPRQALEDVATVRMLADKKKKVPVPAVKSLRLRIDLFSQADDLNLREAACREQASGARLCVGSSLMLDPAYALRVTAPRATRSAPAGSATRPAPGGR
jgi:predicted transcriptional regulator